jgi:hypothetical protein
MTKHVQISTHKNAAPVGPGAASAKSALWRRNDMEAHNTVSRLPSEELDEFVKTDRKLAYLYKGGALDDWMAMVPAMRKVQQIVFTAVHTNNTGSYDYKRKLPHILRRTLPHFLDGDHVRDEWAHILWLDEPDHLMRLDAYRKELTPAKHIALATPKAARNAVQRIIKAEQAALAARQMGVRVEAELPMAPVEPTITDEQFLAAFDKRYVNQLAVVLLAHNFDRSRDLARAIQREISIMKADAKDTALKADASADPHFAITARRSPRRLRRGQ